MSNEIIDYELMGQHFGKSSRTMRRIEQDNPGKFEIMAEKFKLETAEKRGTQIIAGISMKGGCGKSTIINALGSYLQESVVIFNLDLAQEAGDINSCPTLDYAKFIGQASVKEVMDELSLKYRYILIDTPGEISEEFLQIVDRVNHFIVPFNSGKRAREATVNTIDSYFGEGSFLSGTYRVYFLLNQYTGELRRDKAKEEFERAREKITLSDNIKIVARLGALKHSDAIFTMEEQGRSIDELSVENQLAYRVAQNNINKICMSIEEHFNL